MIDGFDAPDGGPHISQLNKMDRARVQQDLQDTLLAIIAQQKIPLLVQLDHVRAVSETHRLKVERWHDPEKGEVLRLEVEAAPSRLIT